MDDLAAILAGGDLSDEEMESVLTVLRGDRQALVNELRAQWAERLGVVCAEITDLVFGLVRQRDALLRVVGTAEAVLDDMPGLLNTYAGDLLARQIAHIRRRGHESDVVITLAPGVFWEMKNVKQLLLIEGERLRLDDAIALSLASLNAYGSLYRHWALAYSGGKDSSATVAFVAWAIKSGQVEPPESLTVLYADTRMELPPLQRGAMRMLDALRADGFEAQVVWPAMDDRFYVYMLGKGVPPPSNTFRWCTGQIKVRPMLDALTALREHAGQKLLMLTGVRLGESAARDQRIALSCGRDSGECGQGWFQHATPEAVADTLAPLLHWRLCHVYDWLYFDDRHGYDARTIAAVYGDGEVRTGCVGCNLASHDTALERLIRHPEWSHLSPLLELKPLYAELKQPRWRKRKAAPELRKDGRYSLNGQRMGPLTMAGRAYGLDRVLDIQYRAGVELINAAEKARIHEMWVRNVWPQRWSDSDIAADVPISQISAVKGYGLVEQALLFGAGD